MYKNPSMELEIDEFSLQNMNVNSNFVWMFYFGFNPL